MPNMILPERVTILDTEDIVRARSTARLVAGRIGFGVVDQTRLATAVSELARNVVQYAGSGSCEIADTSNGDELNIRIVVEDHGPGIHDVEKAMQDGYSTGGSLGAGLPSTRRLMDRFAIETRPGLTRITISMVRHRV